MSDGGWGGWEARSPRAPLPSHRLLPTSRPCPTGAPRCPWAAAAGTHLSVAQLAPPRAALLSCAPMQALADAAPGCACRKRQGVGGWWGGASGSMGGRIGGSSTTSEALVGETLGVISAWADNTTSPAPSKHYRLPITTHSPAPSAAHTTAPHIAECWHTRNCAALKWNQSHFAHSFTHSHARTHPPTTHSPMHSRTHPCSHSLPSHSPNSATRSRSTSSSSSSHDSRLMAGSRCRRQRPMHCWSVRPGRLRAISAQLLPCLQWE